MGRFGTTSPNRNQQRNRNGNQKKNLLIGEKREYQEAIQGKREKHARADVIRNKLDDVDAPRIRKRGGAMMMGSRTWTRRERERSRQASAG